MGTISKALDLLSLFSQSRAEISLVEFVRLTGRDKATVHRHLGELEQNGFLEQHPVSRSYRLGPALLRLAAVREAAFPIRKLLRPIVTDLSEAVGELAHASILQGDALSTVIHADPKLHGTQVHFDESELLPLHATASGLAVLAFAPDELRQRVLARPLSIFTAKTVHEPASINAMLEDVRRDGTSFVASAFDIEVASQGAPIFGEGDKVLGGISVAVPVVRAKPERMAEIAERLREAANRATLSLGGRRLLPEIKNAPRAMRA